MNLSVVDAAGATWPTSGVPRRPRFVLHVEGGVRGDPEPVMLIRGPVSPALMTDLERAPITIANRGLIVTSRIDRIGDDVIVDPESPLELGATYTLVVAGWAKHEDGVALDAILAFPLEVAKGAAGATVFGTFPPDRAFGLPTHLPRVFVAFDDEVTGIEDMFVEDREGVRPAANVHLVPCDTLGFPASTCVALDLTDDLAPAMAYSLVVGPGVRDRSGASVGYFASTFTTGQGDFAPTTLSSGACLLDERPHEDACLIVQDTSIRLRTTASNATYGHLDVGDQRVPFFAPRGEIALVLRMLEPTTDHTLVLTAFDATGTALTRVIDVRTENPMPAIVLSEIRHDPRGKEPAQEYVELWNVSGIELDLSAFTLSDRAESAGDAFPLGARIAPFARVLIVADAFDPNDAEDERVPSGVRLVRVGSAIATSGISNGGEALFLRDAGGRRIAEAPAIATSGEGLCIVRSTGEARIPFPGDYGLLDGAPCTPGF